MTRDFMSGAWSLHLAVGCLLLSLVAQSRAQAPKPVLDTVYPSGGQAGTSVTVALGGTALDGLRDVHTTVPKLTARKLDANRFRFDIPSGTPPGVYDIRAVGTHGMSSPRA